MTDEQRRDSSRATAPNGAFVDIPGGKRTDFPDGSQLIEGRDGDKYILTEDGSISGTIPEIRQVQIGDLAQVLRHDVVTTSDTTSHTLHFIGGGVLAFLHHRDGRGMSFEASRIMLRTLPNGVFVVCGSHA
ncbi:MULTISPECIES: hypothetical protein [Caballeronia]|uniref:hypothetical protein n=1 Tax=Caballeronia TaxID=1827195 RepID=UPI000238909E|nr:MULTISPECIES: hypothetical protein [unclassified Caballeronia]AET88452.1 hypothetical protein BYI23_A006140 [Burkholderia sp. YI23]BAO85664.1 putative uncharacterized protein [Burkholderia sp. RPE67]BBP95499.1 hypothetical protein BSFA1_06280 [Burkholderia sp. SFA1]MCE4542606.1 hypothetical protein [Caballeronia sp. PC1]MCE4568338.1 hypothetical protein [Caballeronia sp. CLC5]